MTYTAQERATNGLNAPGTFEVYSAAGKWFGTFAEFKTAEATADRLNEQHPGGGYTWRPVR